MLSAITLVFVHLSSKKRHFKTHQLTFKLKSVKYDLNTVCQRKKENSKIRFLGFCYALAEKVLKFAISKHCFAFYY